MIKIVKRLSDGKIVYRSVPDFETGNGIKNTMIIYNGNETDYQEIEITEEEWNAAILAGNVKTRSFISI